MKVENWSGHEIRTNDQGKILTEDFMKILEELSDGKYLPPSILDRPHLELPGFYELDDGRIIVPTIWQDDEMLDSENPTVFADVEKAYGVDPKKLRIPSLQSNSEKEKQYVYLIHAVGTALYKIGCSQNVESRLETLSTSSPYSLEMYGLIQSENMFKSEAEIHKKFIAKQINREWYLLDGNDLQELKDEFGLDISVSDAVYKKYSA